MLEVEKPISNRAALPGGPGNPTKRAAAGRQRKFLQGILGRASFKDTSSTSSAKSTPTSANGRGLAGAAGSRTNSKAGATSRSGGIGIILDSKQLSVLALAPGGPAADLSDRVMVGDVLVGVNKWRIPAGTMLGEVAEAVSGPVGTSVELSFRRGADVYKVSLVRREAADAASSPTTPRASVHTKVASEQSVGPLKVTYRGPTPWGKGEKPVGRMSAGRANKRGAKAALVETEKTAPKLPTYRAGVGLTLDQQTFEVRGLVPGGPAAVSGRVSDGDVLLAVDEWRLPASASMQQVAPRVTGEVGTSVSLTMRSANSGQEYEVALVREIARALAPDGELTLVSPPKRKRSGNAETFTAFEWFCQNHALRIREDEGVTTFDEAVALLRKAWDSMSPVMKRPYVLQAECDRKIVKQQRHNQRKALKRERAVPQPVQVLESEEPAQAVASVCGLVDLPSTDLHNPDSWGTADGEGSWTLPDSTQKQEHPLSGSPDVVDDVPEEAFPLTECMESRVEEQTDCFALSEERPVSSPTDFGIGVGMSLPSLQDWDCAGALELE